MTPRRFQKHNSQQSWSPPPSVPPDHHPMDTQRQYDTSTYNQFGTFSNVYYAEYVWTTNAKIELYKTLTLYWSIPKTNDLYKFNAPTPCWSILIGQNQILIKRTKFYNSNSPALYYMTNINQTNLDINLNEWKYPNLPSWHYAVKHPQALPNNRIDPRNSSDVDTITFKKRIHYFSVLKPTTFQTSNPQICRAISTLQPLPSHTTYTVEVLAVILRKLLPPRYTHLST